MNCEGKKIRRGKGQCTIDNKEQCSSFNIQSSFTVRVGEGRVQYFLCDIGEGKSPFSASERGKSSFSNRVGEVRFLSRLEWEREEYFRCDIGEGKSPFSVSVGGKISFSIGVG